MSGAWYTSLTGMLAASHGLQNASGNVANMQSPGFRRKDLFFSSLGQDPESRSRGVQIKGDTTNFGSGHYQETGNNTDLATIGDGFFILKLPNGQWLYTRAGQFHFNEDGFLADWRTGALVMGISKDGSLIPIAEKGPPGVPGLATHSVSLSGTLRVPPEMKPQTMPDPSTEMQESVHVDIGGIQDSHGKSHTLRLTLKLRNAVGCINAEVAELLCDGKPVPVPWQQISFSDAGDTPPNRGNSTLKCTLFGTQEVRLEFGNSMTDNDDAMVHLATKDPLNPDTTITVHHQDGLAAGKPQDVLFGENGQVTWRYDNGKTREGPMVALAHFSMPEKALESGADNTFRCKDETMRCVGKAGDAGFGTIVSGQVEGSNVDPTLEFANMVVLQRMFQACSQMMEIDKQLLEELGRK